MVIEGFINVGSSGQRIEEDDWGSPRAAMVNWITRVASAKEEPCDSEDEVYVDSGIVRSELMVDDFVDKVLVLQDGINRRRKMIGTVTEQPW